MPLRAVASAILWEFIEFDAMALRSGAGQIAHSAILLPGRAWNSRSPYSLLRSRIILTEDGTLECELHSCKTCN
jgi:hypothetical protein